ncbi:hypothetical protein ACEPPN_017674 [Leptodophora sp. 'Broadleaf-Isolate-01']
MRIIVAITVAIIGGGGLAYGRPALETRDTPKVPKIPLPPKPEKIVVKELSLPPVVKSDVVGACTRKINPRGTGCVPINTHLFSGNFLPDNIHVVASINFTGAPAAPNPASIYSGLNLIIVKSDGKTFPNGDSWKCITCGVSAANQIGRVPDMDYPQAFNDGRRVLAGNNIVDCGKEAIASPRCTPDKVHITPIRTNNRADGSGPGTAMRELRLSPDGVHLTFNTVGISGGGLTQVARMGRLVFNSAPTTGTPLAQRYDLVNVVGLYNMTGIQPISVEGDEIFYNPEAISIGELRGFSGRGDEVSFVGFPAESSNIDVFAVHLTTGKIRRLTSHPEYADPVDISPDNNWHVVLDTRGSNRQMFMAGMRGIPPMVDIVATTVASSTRNNGIRRFFTPWLIDKYGDRGSYKGQQLSYAGDGSPGSINDPQWNSRADPKWSWDGTKIAYWEELTLSPACGGANPLPCPVSTAQGGRVQRLLVAYLVERKALNLPRVKPISDIVPWGTPYEVDSPYPVRPAPPPGIYTLKGKASGFAKVNITWTSAGTTVSSVGVKYTNFSDDGINTLRGTEMVTRAYQTPTLNLVDWYSNLTSTGTVTATKVTSPDGFHVSIDSWTNLFNANGTLVTTIDGVTYRQPANLT